MSRCGHFVFDNEDLNYKEEGADNLGQEDLEVPIFSTWVSGDCLEVCACWAEEGNVLQGDVVTIGVEGTDCPEHADEGTYEFCK